MSLLLVVALLVGVVSFTVIKKKRSGVQKVVIEDNTASPGETVSTPIPTVIPLGSQNPVEDHGGK